MGYEELNAAMTSRSLRTIKAELEFLADASVISQVQLSNILRELPADPKSTSQPTQPTPAVATPPTAALNNLSFNEKRDDYYQAPPAGPPPPSYPAYPTPPPTAAPLCHATALYAYNPTDAGDLALIANDRVAVTEYMNAEWWKGSNERTGQEGIFPRSYVKVEEKGGLPTPQQAFSPAPPPTNYGNVPMDMANGGQQGAAGKVGGGKGQEMGKKFGKKLGNAAIFGAGATVGSNIVNSIF